jgi:hypothetical protein
MKTRKIKMRGGDIEKIRGIWQRTKKTSDNPSNTNVERYRDLEIEELTKLTTSDLTNSNAVLESDEMETNFKDMCQRVDRPTPEIEATKEHMREIISRRNEESMKYLKPVETPLEKTSRKGHEHRLTLWRKKYKEIRRIYYDRFKESLENELPFLSSEKATLTQKRDYLAKELRKIVSNRKALEAGLPMLYKGLSKLIAKEDVKEEIDELLFRFHAKYPETNEIEWLSDFISQKEKELESLRELQEYFDETERNLNEVDEDIVVCTPQKPKGAALEHGDGVNLSSEMTNEAQRGQPAEEMVLKDAIEQAEEEAVTLLFDWEIEKAKSTSRDPERDKTMNALLKRSNPSILQSLKDKLRKYIDDLELIPIKIEELNEKGKQTSHALTREEEDLFEMLDELKEANKEEAINEIKKNNPGTYKKYEEEERMLADLQKLRENLAIIPVLKASTLLKGGKRKRLTRRVKR